MRNWQNLMVFSLVVIPQLVQTILQLITFNGRLTASDSTLAVDFFTQNETYEKKFTQRFYVANRFSPEHCGKISIGTSP
jgi:hypothetical protein